MANTELDKQQVTSDTPNIKIIISINNLIISSTSVLKGN